MRTKTKKCAQEILGQMRFMLLYLRVPKPSFLYLFPSLFNTLVPKIAKKKKKPCFVCTLVYEFT